MYLEYITLGLYLLILPVLGLLFSKLNKNLSDYVRGGAQATWWLAGASIMMSNTSAFTFTGNASMAFLAGPTVLTIYAANVCALLISGFFLAAWFRQTRAYTTADVVRSRFGPAARAKQRSGSLTAMAPTQSRSPKSRGPGSPTHAGRRTGASCCLRAASTTQTLTCTLSRRTGERWNG